MSIAFLGRSNNKKNSKNTHADTNDELSHIFSFKGIEFKTQHSLIFITVVALISILIIWIFALRIEAVNFANEVIRLPNQGEFGLLEKNQNQGTGELKFKFEGKSGNLALFFESYDIEFPDEIEILVNGQFIAFVVPAKSEAWSPTRKVLLPDCYVTDQGWNILTFRSKNNKEYWWGIRNIDITNPIPDQNKYGNIPGGDTAHKKKVSYYLGKPQEEIVLRYEAWNINYKNEVAVLINNKFLSYLEPTLEGDAWETNIIKIDKELLNSTKSNILIFQNMINSQDKTINKKWGIGNLSFVE